jgi:hypothetical protein
MSLPLLLPHADRRGVARARRLGRAGGRVVERVVPGRQTEDNDASSLSFLSGLIFGLVVGIVVAFGLAPQSGRRTRQTVWETGIELRARAPHWRRANADASDDTLADEAERAEVAMHQRLADVP